MQIWSTPCVTRLVLGALLWAVTQPIDVTVESAELPPHAMEVPQVAGGLRHLQGRYNMQVLQANPAQVQLGWTGSITPESDLPPLIGLALMRHLIQAQFAGLVREIERRAAAQLLTAPAPAPAPMAWP